MIIRTELLQDSCSKILNAVDSNVLSAITETLEIVVKNKVFSMSVTNREYFVKISVDTDVTEEFHATVNANLFLKLVSKVTSETIELTVDGNSLHVKCNGDYMLPLIYDGDKLMILPSIEVEEVIEEVDVETSILHSIASYNSGELEKGTISKPVQKLYFVDSKGAVTFTTGACVNKFHIDMNSKLFFNDKLVKLFKLFKEGKVKMTVGRNKVVEDTYSTSVRFEAPGIFISAVLPSDNSFYTGFPVDAIRGRSENLYNYSASFNKDLLIAAIDRLMLFASVRSKDLSATVIKMVFGRDGVIISDKLGVNTEEVLYSKSSDNIQSYTAFMDSKDLSKTLDTCSNQIVEFHFGDSQAFIVTEGAVKFVLPECKID